MVTAFIWLLVIVIMFGILWYALDAIPVPQPLNRWIKIIAVCIAGVGLIIVLMNFGGIAIPR